MRKSKLPLKKLYTLTKHILEKININQQVKKKGRPQKYEEAENENFDVPCYIADATGLGFGDKYNLNWKRGRFMLGLRHLLPVLFFGTFGYL